MRARQCRYVCWICPRYPKWECFLVGGACRTGWNPGVCDLRRNRVLHLFGLCDQACDWSDRIPGATITRYRLSPLGKRKRNFIRTAQLLPSLAKHGGINSGGEIYLTSIPVATNFVWGRHIGKSLGRTAWDLWQSRFKCGCACEWRRGGGGDVWSRVGCVRISRWRESAVRGCWLSYGTIVRKSVFWADYFSWARWV